MDLLGNGGLGSVNDDGPSDDEIAICNYVDQKIDESRKSANRVAHESIWMQNCAHLLGYVNTQWSSEIRAFVSSNMAGPAARRNRLQTNVILPTIHNRTARLCKSLPKYEVRPNSNDSDDKDATRLGKMIIEHYWDNQKLSRKRIDLTMWKQQCGHSYMKVSWDPTLGRQITDPITGESQFEGDIRVDVVPAFEVYPDPAAKSMEELQWLAQTKIRPLSYFKSAYPGVGDKVKEEQTTILGLQYQQRINSLNAKGGGEGNSQSVKNTAVEKVYYEKPTAKRPNGRMIITANGVLLEDKELPVAEIPFSKFDDIVIGGKFYSESIVTHMRPLQDQLNRLVNQRNDWIRKLLAGKYAVARGAGIHAEALNDQSGEILEYDPVPQAPDGGRPTAMAVPMIPQYAYTEEDRILKRMYDIAGVSDVARGEIPSASIPAMGMQILLESDQTRVGIVTDADELSWAVIGKLILKYAQKFIVEPRLLKISSNNGYMVRSFQGADLRGNDDVIVIKGSTVPNSTVMKRQDIMNVYGQGLLGDPADPAVREKVLGMLEFGDIAEAWKDQALDEKQVKQAIESIEQGVPVMVSEFDNHAYWLRELNRYRKSDKFQKLEPFKQQLLMQLMEECIRGVMPEGMKNPSAPIAHDALAPMTQGQEAPVAPVEPQEGSQML